MKKIASNQDIHLGMASEIAHIERERSFTFRGITGNYILLS